MKAEEPEILVVASNAAHAGHIASLVRSFGCPRIASSHEAPLIARRAPRLLAAVIADLGRAGLEVGTTLRGQWAVNRVLVSLGTPSPADLSAALRGELAVVGSPMSDQDVMTFLASARDSEPRTRAARVAATLGHEWRLSPAELRILRLVVDGTPRASLPEILGTTPNTVKTQIRSILRKSDMVDISEMLRSVLLRSMQAQQGTAPRARQLP